MTEINNDNASELVKIIDEELKRITEPEKTNQSSQTGFFPARQLPDNDPTGTETSLRSIADNLPVLISQVDTNCIYRYANAQYEEWFGVAPSDIIGKHVSEVLGPALYEKARQSIEMALKGVSSEYESEHPHKHGHIISYRARYVPNFDGNGVVVSYSVIVDDITERKRARELIFQNEKRFRELFNNMSSGVAVYQAMNDGGDFVFLDINAAAEKILRCPKKEIINRRVTDCFPGVRELGLFIVFQSVWTTGVPERLPVGIYKDGRINIWVDNYVYKLPTGEIVAVFDDVTEKKNFEEQMLLAKEKAEESSKAKSEFLSTMSHEVRTPLNGVLGMLQLVKTTDLNDQQKEFIEIAEVSARNLLKILNDILDISSIESGRIKILSEEFSPESLLRDMQSVFTDEVNKKKLSFTLDIDPLIPATLKGDQARLRQILLNVIGNAVKFTPGGTVAVKAELSKTISVDSLYLAFKIEDTGVGIPKEKMDMIFEPFTQADGSFTRPFGGTGLGLNIVKRLVKLLGGQLSLDSKAGIGTKVCISLPFRRAVWEKTPSKPLPTDKQSYGLIEGAKALIVEDEKTNRMALNRLLQKIGMSADCVENGREAIDALLLDGYDVILMDIQMPVMDGVEATKIIRSLPDPAKRAVPIVAVTAYALPEDRSRFLSAGMNEYLSKPFSMEELRTKLSTVLSA